MSADFPTVSMGFGLRSCCIHAAQETEDKDFISRISNYKPITSGEVIIIRKYLERYGRAYLDGFNKEYKIESIFMSLGSE